MALNPDTVDSALGHLRVREFDARLADLEAEKKRITEQRKLYEPAAKRYAAEQKKADKADAGKD